MNFSEITQEDPNDGNVEALGKIASVRGGLKANPTIIRFPLSTGGQGVVDDFPSTIAVGKSSTTPWPPSPLGITCWSHPARHTRGQLGKRMVVIKSHLYPRRSLMARRRLKNNGAPTLQPTCLPIQRFLKVSGKC